MILTPSKKLLLALGTALVVSLPITASAKTLTIGFDFSGSNQLITDKHFAHGAGAYVAKRIQTLKSGDVVRVMTFGSRQSASNLVTREIKISRQARPKKVAQMIQGAITSLPTLPDIAQNSTNLIAWLEFTSGFDCASGGEIIALTDGVEYSDLVDGNAFLQTKATLPKADVDLKGCSLSFYGLGTGFPATSVKHIRNEWRKWAKQSGASFHAIIP